MGQVRQQQFLASSPCLTVISYGLRYWETLTHRSSRSTSGSAAHPFAVDWFPCWLLHANANLWTQVQVPHPTSLILYPIPYLPPTPQLYLVTVSWAVASDAIKLNEGPWLLLGASDSRTLSSKTKYLYRPHTHTHTYCYIAYIYDICVCTLYCVLIPPEFISDFQLALLHMHKTFSIIIFLPFFFPPPKLFFGLSAYFFELKVHKFYVMGTEHTLLVWVPRGGRVEWSKRLNCVSMCGRGERGRVSIRAVYKKCAYAMNI